MPKEENTQLFIAIIGSTILFLILSGFIIIFVLIYKKRRNQHTLEMTQLKQAYEQELLKSQLEIQEQTFRSISLEIHDNIGQVLSLAKLNVSIFSQQSGHPPMLTDTRDLLTKAINDLRDLSKGLSPERVAEIDLAQSVGHEMQILEKTGLYTTKLNVQGGSYTLPPEKKIILFRIFQEVINNVVKHAGATRVDVSMRYSPSSFQLFITDNGIGFDTGPQKSNLPAGIGLTNMRHRSTLIGATFQLQSAEGSGTHVTISLPTNEAA